MSRSLQLGLRTGDLFQTPSVPRSCSGIISKTDTDTVFYSRVSSSTYIQTQLFYRLKPTYSCKSHGQAPRMILLNYYRWTSHEIR